MCDTIAPGTHRATHKKGKFYDKHEQALTVQPAHMHGKFTDLTVYWLGSMAFPVETPVKL